VQVPFTLISGLFQKRPKAIVAISALLILLSLVLASRVTYEKDLFKVFLARDMESMAVSERISRKFHSNFSQPILLSFDVENVQEGLSIQRSLDDILEKLIDRDREIASFDSISYLLSPDSVRRTNSEALADVLQSLPDLNATFEERLKRSDFSKPAAEIMKRSFDGVGTILKKLKQTESGSYDEVPELEKSWYIARVDGNYRFLTRIRLSDKIRDPDELAKTDQAILDAVGRLPVPVSISGPRKAMEAMLATLVSELIKLGLYAFVLVIAVFFVIFPHPLGVALCLIPMIGGFSITLGAIGLTNMGLPFSIVCVAPLIFGFGIHNGIHVVMGSLHEKGGSVERTVKRVTPRSMVTSLTITMGFVSMLTSQHYALSFLGETMVIGMMASVPLTLVTLPALLLLIERRRAIGHIDSQE
jgi:predicted RND superfamily exporter protein